MDDIDRKIIDRKIIDRKIIEILKKDARMPIVKIAKVLDLPDTTIHYRLKAMKESGEIRLTVETKLDVELREKTSLSGFINAELGTIQKMTQKQKSEIELLCVAVKGLTRRLEKIEKKP